MYLLGYDIGSSSVKATLLDVETGKTEASAFYPKEEMTITAHQQGWAEQDPDLWWENLKLATHEVLKDKEALNIKAIGISYQMHGLVMVDKNLKHIRPSIIWCDSRAIPYGDKAFQDLGSEKCLSHLLNSPGNFTAAKFAWVKDQEKELFDKTYKIMLPGDYIALKMTGEACTTASGLSEGILWDFREDKPAGFLLDYFGFEKSHIPDIVPGFAEQGFLMDSAAKELGLPAGIPVAYRAGDQPNNAFSLNVLNPGEIAATAGTSGVVYGVSDEIKYDPQSRVNTFAHVNYTEEQKRLGVLLCINGTGITYSWLRKLTNPGRSYPELNEMASAIKPGSEGISIFPFGNGAERMLGNKNPGFSMKGIQYNTHSEAHIMRAAQESIAFAFRYGMDIMKTTGIQPQVIRAGKANLFLSDIFRKILATLSNSVIELYDTDGSAGAARGAGVGAGIYKDFEDAFSGLKKIEVIEPDASDDYTDIYENWKETLNNIIH